MTFIFKQKISTITFTSFVSALRADYIFTIKILF